MQFRKICNHPFVFPEVEQMVNPRPEITYPGEERRTDYVSDTIYRVSGKFELLDRILPKYFKTGHRVLMFFQMTLVWPPFYIIIR
jgi:ATP-dependent helicase STH1/SNF2